jgi:hypothetical protein
MRTAIVVFALAAITACPSGDAVSRTQTEPEISSIFRGVATCDLAPLSGARIELVNTRTGEILTTYSAPGGSFRLDAADLGTGYRSSDIVKIVASPVTEGRFSPTLTMMTSMSSDVREVEFRLRTPPRDETYEFWVGDVATMLGDPEGLSIDSYAWATGVYADLDNEEVTFYGNNYFSDNLDLGRTCQAHYGLAVSGNYDPPDLESWENYNEDGSDHSWDADRSIVFCPGDPQLGPYWYSASIYSLWRYQLEPGGDWSTWGGARVDWASDIPVYNHLGIEEAGECGWEFAQSALGAYGNVAAMDNVTGMQYGQAGDQLPYECPGALNGASYLHVAEEPHSGTPQVFLAWVQGLTDGDVVSASFHGYDVTPGGAPSMRIWAHTGDSYDVDSYVASAGGNANYTAGTGWDCVDHSWTFDSSGGAADALIIEARLYSSPATGEFRTDFFLDLLNVGAPATATIVLPESPTGCQPAKETSWGSIKSLYR